MRFGIGGIVGGPDASHVSGYTDELLALLRELASHDYCPSIEVVGFVFSIDGSLVSKEKTGVGTVRFHRPSSSIGCDIFVPVDKWRGKTPRTIREYIASCFVVALDKCIEKIRKLEFPLDEAAMRRDVADVLDHFLSTGSPEGSDAHRRIVMAASKAEELLALKKILGS